MSENIIITDGVKQPWELPGTDYDKPEDIILANLALGQLAFIGSMFGKYINTQAMVTAELAEAVEKVKARSTQASLLFQNWNTNSLKLDLTMPSQGLYPAEPSLVNLNSTTPTAVDKLVIANNLLIENEIANRYVPPLKPDTDLASVPCTYTFGPVGSSGILTGFSPYAAALEMPGIPIDDLQLYNKQDASGAYDYSKFFVKFEGNEYEAQNLKAIWIPSSSAEIDYFNSQLSLVDPAKNSEILRDATQLVPVPSEVNSIPDTGTDGIEQPVVTMEVPITQPDFFRFKLEIGGYYFYEKALSKIPVYDENTISSNVGSVVQMQDKSYCYVLRSNIDPVNPYVLVKATPEPCLKNPNDLQRSDILSKYSDKVVRITQRSTEQGNYVTALVQRYNYSFEAATNILKAFTNLGSTLVSNI